MPDSPPYDFRRRGPLGEDDQFIVWGTHQTIFSSIRGPLAELNTFSASGWMAAHLMGIDLQDRCVELRRPREWVRVRIVADEPASQWTWSQLRDGLVDVGRIPLDAVIYHVQQRPGLVCVSYWSKTGPVNAVPIVGPLVEAFADVP